MVLYAETARGMAAELVLIPEGLKDLSRVPLMVEASGPP